MKASLNINIMGNILHLRPSEVESCKKIVCELIDNVRDAAADSLSPTYYFTLLIVMHYLSQDLLSDMEDKSLNIIFNHLSDTNEKGVSDDKKIFPT